MKRRFHFSIWTKEEMEKKNRGKKGVVFIDCLDEKGCVCHFENISLTEEQNKMIRELRGIYWEKIRVGSMNRFFLFVSFGKSDNELNLESLIETFFWPHTKDIRIRETESKSKKYISYETYKEKRI